MKKRPHTYAKLPVLTRAQSLVENTRLSYAAIEEVLRFDFGESPCAVTICRYFPRGRDFTDRSNIVGLTRGGARENSPVGRANVG